MYHWKHGKAGLSCLAAGAMITLLGTSLLIAGKPTTPVYTFTDLGGFAGLTSVQSEAKAVSNVNGNELLTVVGYSNTSTPHMADPAAWTVTAAGVVVSVADLGAPATASGTWAFGVNVQGVSVGNVVAGPPFSGFVFVPGVGTIPLPTFGGNSSSGNGINNFGAIVGSANAADATRWGALWHVDNQGIITGAINLGTFFPNAINDSGTMAGSQGGAAAIAWIDAGILHTQSLGVLSQGHIGSNASAINNLGEVVGASNAPDSTGGVLPQAFLWRAGTMTALGNLGGGTSSASSINDSSQVVGSSADQQGGTVPFLWRDGTISNLNTLAGLGAGKRAITATGINNRGHIVGLGSVSVSRKSSELHGYLLTPKP